MRHAGDEQQIAADGVGGAVGALPYAGTIQHALGRHEIGDVRAHTDQRAQQASQSIDATAYATGNDIAFAGTPDLHTAANEAAHVVQQRSGVAKKGGASSDVFEEHADRVADLVVAGQSAESSLDQMAGPAAAAVRRKQPDATRAHAPRSAVFNRTRSPTSRPE